MNAETRSVEPVASRSPWNSLELAKLIMAATTPIALFAIGFIVTKQVDRQEKREAATEQAAAEARSRDLARSSKIIDRRIEFWDKLAPKLSQLDRTIDRLLIGEGNVEEVETIFREIDDVFGLYRPYFSPGFAASYEQYRKTIRDFAELAASPTTVKGLVAMDGLMTNCRQYVALRDSAASEVAQATGLVQDRAGPGRTSGVEVECQRRVDRALAKLEGK